MRVIKHIICIGLLFMLCACQNNVAVVQNENIKIFPYNEYDYINTDQPDLWQKNIVTKADFTFSLSFADDIVSAEDFTKIKAIASYLSAHENARVKLLGHANIEGSSSYRSAIVWAKLSDIASYFEQNGIEYERIVIISLGGNKLNADYSGVITLQNGVVEVFYEGV